MTTDTLATGLAFTQTEHTVTGILYIVLGILGIIGNGTLAVMLARLKTTQASKYQLHIQFAIANILVVAGFPFTGSSSIAGRWLFGSVGCQAYSFEGMLAGIASIGFVIAVCIERYVATCCKETYRTKYPNSSNTIVLLIWGNALFWGLMPLLGWCRYGLEPTGVSCTINYQIVDQQYKSFILALFCCCFAILWPIALICLMKAYSALARTPASERDREKEAFTEEQITAMSFTSLMLSVIGWTPFAFICLYSLLYDSTQISHLGATLPPLLAKGSTVLHPLLYLVAGSRLQGSFSSRRKSQ
uniref:Retinochrome n=1 Tax=Nautilus pompilius TaxID=34573 RepID=A0A0H5ANK7_9MOLL|nr:retinochrome [Nautilus pompilius]